VNQTKYVTPTIGYEFNYVKYSYENKNFSVKIWDTVGQDKFFSNTKLPVQKGDLIILVIDICDIFEATENSDFNFKDTPSNSCDYLLSDKFKIFLLDNSNKDVKYTLFCNKMDEKNIKLKKQKILDLFDGKILEDKIQKFKIKLKKSLNIDKEIDHYYTSAYSSTNPLDEIIKDKLKLFIDKKLNENIKITKTDKSDSGEGGRCCFSHKMNLSKKDFKYINISNVKKFDEILTLDLNKLNTKNSENSHSFINLNSSLTIKSTNFLTYLHQNTNRKCAFLKIMTDENDLNDILEISHDHLIMSVKNQSYIHDIMKNGFDFNGKFIKAGLLQEGDYLLKYCQLANGVHKPIWKKILKIDSIVDIGLYAPLTEEGTLLVNNYLVSCYASIDSHKIAHLAMIPLIIGSKYNLMDVRENSEGINTYCQSLMNFYEKFKFIK